MARSDRPTLGGVPGRLPMLLSSAVVVVVAAAVVAVTRTPGDPAGPVTLTQVGAARVGAAHVGAETTPGQAPVASVVARVLRVPELTGGGRPPVLVGLDASGSTDPDGEPLTYRWDLDGDGHHDDGARAAPRVRLTGRAPAVVTVVVRDGTGLTDVARLRLPGGPRGSWPQR
ncbi:PKD domain-containing protein [Nocardioides sp. AX2bis]|uniref:PKD domain-containing protein n=1 Tax=Nocardioides sp. AX2bis TaxID=2653157 RepID=UPI0012F1E8FB|nr:PKD domain-containing protein [Nocardioides sp. AX2bis]VXB95606.1 exported hypothetical protein [Nocardioides sp. AX2bis]